MSNVIGIYTGKDLATMQKEGGSGYWKAKSYRIKQAEYAIFMRNHRETWAVKDDGFQHGQAFMIAKIKGCVKTEKYAGRKVIQLSEYAELPSTDEKFKKAWKKLTAGQRYPVAYLELEEVLEALKLNLDSLVWSNFNVDNSQVTIEDSLSDNLNDDTIIESSSETKDLSQIINHAKTLISEQAGISEDKINIQINF